VKETFAVDLNGVVAVVTGASRGAGHAVAVVLGEAGATVYLTGRSVRSRSSAPRRSGTLERRLRRSRGLAFITASIAALAGVPEHESGLASATPPSRSVLPSASPSSPPSPSRAPTTTWPRKPALVVGACRGLGHGIATALRRGRCPPPQRQALAGRFQWPSGFCGAIALAAIPAALLLVRGAVPPAAAESHRLKEQWAAAPEHEELIAQDDRIDARPARRGDRGIQSRPGMTNREQASDGSKGSRVSNEETTKEAWK
jgi:hypothetical protein